MDIANNIRRLRLRGDMTQEELANLIGCSPQAVSRWERGDGYPEMTMMPVIANVFGVTMDELFGMDEQRKQERFDDYCKRIDEILQSVNTDGYGLHNIDEFNQKIAERDVRSNALVDEALREFAGDMKREMELAMRLMGDGEKKAVGILERIRERSTDDTLRAEAFSRLITLLANLGETDRAIALAESLPPNYSSREHTLMYVYGNVGGSKLAESAQKVLDVGKRSIQNALQALRLVHAQEHGDVRNEVSLELFKKDLELRLLTDEHKLFGPIEIVHNCNAIVMNCMFAGLHEQALDYCEKALDCLEAKELPEPSILNDRLYAPDETRELRARYNDPQAYQNMYHNMLMNLSPLEQLDWYARNKLMMSSVEEFAEKDPINYKNALEKEARLDPIRDNPRYIAALERVRKRRAEFAEQTQSTRE